MVVCSNYFITIYIQKQTICELKKKRKRNSMTKDNRIITLLYSTFVEFLLFLIMPNFVETVLSMRISVAVCLSELQELDLTLFYFSSYFLFSF